MTAAGGDFLGTRESTSSKILDGTFGSSPYTENK
jgi:hypothetical protein